MKVGSRIKYVGIEAEPDRAIALKNEIGTVVQFEEGEAMIKIQWDNHDIMSWVFPEEITEL